MALKISVLLVVMKFLCEVPVLWNNKGYIVTCFVLFCFDLFAELLRESDCIGGNVAPWIPRISRY